MSVRLKKGTKNTYILDQKLPDGSRRQEIIPYATNKADAIKFAAAIISQRGNIAYGYEKPDMLFAEFVADVFLPYSEASKKSHRCDLIACEVFGKYFKGKTLRQMTPEVIDRFKLDWLKTPVVHKKKDGTEVKRPRAKASVNNYLMILSKIFSMAVKRDYLDTNPVRKVDKFKVDNRRTRVLSQEEQTRLMAALAGNPLVRDIVILAINTGMRQDEIFSLRWEDVHFERKLLVATKTKNGKQRYIPLNATVQIMLAGRPRESEYVFASPVTGGKLNNIKRSWASAKEQAGITNFRFHDLRHTAATRMGKARDPFALAAVLGHSDIRQSHRYTHPESPVIREMVDSLVANTLQ